MSWAAATLGDVLKVRHGRSQHAVESPSGKFPILATGGRIGWSRIPLYSKPSVLIGRKGTIDRPQYQDEPFWTIDTLFYTELAKSVDPRFIFYIFQTIDWRSMNEASGVPSLSSSRIEAISVRLPALQEQTVIRQTLDDIDDLIATLERLVAKKQAIKQGMMQQLLTGRTRLPGFSDQWQEIALGSVTRIKTGSRNNQDKSLGGRYPFFVRSATIEQIDSYSYDCEAILVPGEGGIGSIFHYINGKFEVHQRVYKISDFSSGVDGRFVYYFMRQFFGRHAMENSVKATVDSLRLPTFSNFPIQLPPPEEQEAIVNLLVDVDDEVTLLRHRLDKARDIKTGMMQQLLTGRTRLPMEVVS